jgi:uncharacterized protein (TIGR03084 family)
VEEVMSALVAEQAELSGFLSGLGAADWSRPSRCEGWDIADVVLHLAQTNELAVGSARGQFDAVLERLAGGLGPAGSVDEAVAAMVERERGAAGSEVFARWSSSASELEAVLDAGDMSERVKWVAGHLSLRTLATTRLAETWIHTGDIADAVGISVAPTDRLKLIARLAWRTLPYAFSSSGRDWSGSVAFRLTSPDGTLWEFWPDEPAVTTISGPAADLCAVASRRVPASETALHGEGPDASAVLDLVRTYA